MVSLELEDKALGDYTHVYAVTNRHVINDTTTPCRVIRVNTQNMQFEPLQVDGWFFPIRGHDIAVAPLGLDAQTFKFRTIPLSLFVTPEDLGPPNNIGPGDEVFVVGRFVNVEGKQRNTPALRFGAISMLPEEAIEHSGGEEAQDFLVEARSIAGFSGSPVFVYVPPLAWRPNVTEVTTSYRIWLLGVDWGHIRDEQQVWHTMTKKSPDFVKGNTGMMAVCPAWTLRDLLESQELIMGRRKAEDQLRKKPKSAVEADMARQLPKPLTKEGFETTLKRVSRRASPDREAKET